MAIDWSYWLDRKYSNLEGQTAADTTRANAYARVSNSEANVNDIKAGFIPQQSLADIAETQARTKQLGVATGLMPAEAAARNASLYGTAYKDRSEGSLDLANVNRINSPVDPLLSGLLLQRFGYGLPSSGQSTTTNGYGFTTSP